MRNPEGVLNTLCKHSNELNYKYERLYRILFNEQMFYVAYQRIYAKQGNMTAGTDGRTVDQMSIQRIDNLIVALKDESYQPHPARRVYIPKKNGAKRPLGIPSFEDKLVQEVIRMTLEAIYEGHFEWTSHGFRPQRSCHTALISLQKQFNGAKWFIEGDIKGFFDNIDHNVLIETMKERISDERFLRLIRKFLKAGYIENWKYNNTYSGTPQGGIISPILANIYLDKFDKYMNEYMEKFDKGTRRRRNKEIGSLNNKVFQMKKRANIIEDKDERESAIAEIKKVQRQILCTQSAMPIDDTYRRLKYVRYADDFLIGVIGTKAECEHIKADIAEFMTTKLKLELSEEKTLITNAQEAAKFLGYDIYVRKDFTVKRNSAGVVRRHHNGNVVLHLSKETIQKRLNSYKTLKIENIAGKEVWESKARTEMIGKEPADILAQYNIEIRGFYNYYSIANNSSAIGSSFACIMKYSLYKTLAQKLNISVRKIINKYRRDKDFIIPYKDSKGQTKYRILYNGGFKRNKEAASTYCDNEPFTLCVPYPSLIERLMNGKCEICGASDNVLMHHVRNINLLKGENEWERIMLKKHRKTLVVCENCNNKIQNYGK